MRKIFAILLFSFPCFVIGAMMCSECISIHGYTKNICEMKGELSIKKSLFSSQGLSNIVTENNITFNIRYPSSKYWNLYVNSEDKIKDWYIYRVNKTFRCKTNDMAVTEDCDYIMPMFGMIISMINIIGSVSWLCLYKKTNKTIPPLFDTVYINEVYSTIV